VGHEGKKAAPIRDRRGVLLGAILIFRDVIEKCRLTTELIQQAGHRAWISTTVVWTAFASICWMMRPRGLAAGHADLAIHAAKAARKDQFQWVE